MMKIPDTYSEFYEQSAILMVTYNAIPNFKRIRDALKFVKYIILMDNNSRPEIKSEILKFSKSSQNCISIFNDSNYGVSHAYNLGVNYAKSIGIEWVFFLDGDANVSNEYFTESFLTLKEALKLKVKVGVICPIVGDSEHIKMAKFRDKFSFIGSSITSGIMININVFLKVGGYNEDIFVEGADLDFTKKIVMNGMKICRINRILITQTFGKGVSFKPNIIFKFFNIVSFASSFLSLRLGKLNVIRTRYPIYDSSRREQYYSSFGKSSDILFKPSLILYSIIAKLLDTLFLNIVCKFGGLIENKLEAEVKDSAQP